MSDKSYVTMESAVCPVCGARHDTGNLLLDKRLRQKFDRHTITGWAMCGTHQKLKDDNYTAVVGIDPDKSNGHTVSGVWRTGLVAHIRNSVWGKLFNQPLPDKGICFAPDEVLQMLQERQAQLYDEL